MLYHVQSPFYQWFLTSSKKQRTKVENAPSQQAPVKSTPKPFTE